MLLSSSPRSRTMSRPWKLTDPPTTSPGGDSRSPTAKSSVDFPQPDSPTMPRNSPGSTAKLTPFTARTSAASVRYSTDRSVTSSRGSVTLLPSRRPQRGIPDLVEGVVDECETCSQQDHRCPGRQSPPGVARLERGRLLSVVEHRAPHQLAAVAQSQELQAGGEADLEARQCQERGGQKRDHGRDDLDQDDVERPLSPHACRHEEVAAAHRQALGAELPGLERPAGDREDDDQGL